MTPDGERQVAILGVAAAVIYLIGSLFPWLEYGPQVVRPADLAVITGGVLFGAFSVVMIEARGRPLLWAITSAAALTALVLVVRTLLSTGDLGPQAAGVGVVAGVGAWVSLFGAAAALVLSLLPPIQTARLRAGE